MMNVAKEFFIQNLNDPEKAVIYGLSWSPLLGDDVAKASRKFALAHKATHFCAADTTSACVGTIQIPAAQKTRLRKEVVSAAALFAHENKQGVSLACIQLPDKGEAEPLFWVVGSQDGVIVAGTDEVCGKAQAEQIYRQLQERFRFHVEETGFNAEKAGMHWASSKLLECKTPLQALPLWAKAGFSVFLLATAAHLGWGYWSDYANSQKNQHRAEFKVDEPKVWREHVQNWANLQQVDGSQGLTSLYQEVGNVPVRIGNWLLTSIDCSPTQQGWSCHLAYAKAAGGNNDTFVKSVPSSWVVGWDGLGKAVATYNFASKRQSLNLSEISSSQALSIGYFATLQAVLPAFQQVKVSTEAPIKLPNPSIVDDQGKHVSVNYPSGEAQAPLIPSKQSILFYGPLRSLSVLPVDSMTHFTRLQVQVNQDVVTDASLGKSMLMATLEGELYVF